MANEKPHMVVGVDLGMTCECCFKVQRTEAGRPYPDALASD